MKTPLTQEIDRLTKINAELVRVLRGIVTLNGSRLDADLLFIAKDTLAKATKPCTRACESCECHEGVMS